jgi:hypothetical protein
LPPEWSCAWQGDLRAWPRRRGCHSDSICHWQLDTPNAAEIAKPVASCLVIRIDLTDCSQSLRGELPIGSREQDHLPRWPPPVRPIAS